MKKVQRFWGQPIRLATILALIAGFSPVFAIVVANGNPNDYEVSYGETVLGLNLSGVVEITSSIGGCTGTLLTGGLSILTAGHCVTSSYGSPIASNITVYFQGPSGMVAATVSNVQVDPGYTGDGTQGGDLAVLTLTQPAPSFAIGYSLYTNPAFPSDPVVLAGYGIGGTGNTGADSSAYPFGTLRAGENVFEGTADEFFLGWSSELLIGQLYDGQPCTRSHCTDALSIPDPYFSGDEVGSAHGDSGGPAFYNGMIAGVTDLGICYISATNANACATPPSVNAANNSYFGEMFGYTSVAANLAFIESATAPEPGTAALLLGVACVAWGIRRRRTARP